jgi:stage III sporulation protein AF
VKTVTELKDWIINICTAVFFITAVEMILPDNNMKKYAKFVLGLILITILINPLVMLLNKGNDISAFIGKSINTFNDFELNSKKEDYREQSLNDTLQVFARNVQDTCTKKLKEKYPNINYKVKANVTYNKEKDEFEIKELEIGVAGGGKVEKVQKVEVKPSSNFNETSRIESEMSGEIKEYLSTELKLSKSIISVYKLNA